MGIILLYIHQDSEDSFAKGKTWYVVFFKYIGWGAREKDADDVERAKNVQLYDLAWEQKCPESGNWQQST